MRLLSAAAGLGLALAALPAFAGHTVEETVTQSGGTSPGQSMKMVMSWEGPRLRTDSGAQNMSVIIDFKGDKMIYVNHHDKQYSEISLNAFIEQMKSAMEMMKAQMKNLPPEQQKQLGSMFSDEPMTFEATNETAKIAGMTATKYLVKRGSSPVGEAWLSKEVDFADLAPYMEKFSDAMKGAMGGGGSGFAGLFGKMDKGFPLRSVNTSNMMGRQLTSTTEVQKYSSKALGADFFKAPSGYSKIDMPLPGQPGAGHGPARSTMPPANPPPSAQGN